MIEDIYCKMIAADIIPDDGSGEDCQRYDRKSLYRCTI